jgi:hypothetical protein
MQIRFLQTCASDNPDYPFMAGQVIDVPALSRLLQSHVFTGLAEFVREDETECAVVVAAEVPEPKKRGRTRVAR